MKRLTEKNESPCTCCGGIGSCRTDCNYKQIYDRLTEYEDTGLTPKEIEDMVSVREITPETEYAIDKHANNLIQKLEQLIAQTDEKNELQRYKEAEEQGLLVRLPCKLGDTVYWIMECSCLNIDGVYSKCEFYGYEPDYGADCEICNRPEGTKCPHQYRISEGRAKEQNILMIARNLGKTVFLTREEAEKALEALEEV